jgi:hypothetical protein
MAGMFLASLDQTIVATALPTLVDRGADSGVNGVGHHLTVPSTCLGGVFQPGSGRLNFARHSTWRRRAGVSRRARRAGTAPVAQRRDHHVRDGECGDRGEECGEYNGQRSHASDVDDRRCAARVAGYESHRRVASRRTVNARRADAARGRPRSVLLLRR